MSAQASVDSACQIARAAREIEACAYEIKADALSGYSPLNPDGRPGLWLKSLDHHLAALKAAAHSARSRCESVKRQYV